ncbi:MAG TPA: hypothetical protein VH208_02935, partial [Myxococcaceae bacterium]|nr:hypothetical protein [Myxococcaceae bacterium]
MSRIDDDKKDRARKSGSSPFQKMLKKPGPSGGGGGKGGSRQRGPEVPWEEGEVTDEEATILEDPSIVERPVVPEGGFRY